MSKRVWISRGESREEGIKQVMSIAGGVVWMRGGRRRSSVDEGREGK